MILHWWRSALSECLEYDDCVWISGGEGASLDGYMMNTEALLFIYLFITFAKKICSPSVSSFQSWFDSLKVNLRYWTQDQMISGSISHCRLLQNCQANFPFHIILTTQQWWVHGGTLTISVAYSWHKWGGITVCSWNREGKAYLYEFPSICTWSCFVWIFWICTVHRHKVSSASSKYHLQQ